MIDTDKYEGHTEGGWYVDDAPDVIHPTVIHENQCDCMVAELVPITGEWTEEDYANARLIADAPKLLAEVKRLRKTNEFHMMLDAEETKEQLKLQKENDNLTKLCIERYAEVKRLREGIEKALIPTDTNPIIHPLTKLCDLRDALKELIE